MQKFLCCLFLCVALGCEAQMQNWQKARTVEHLSRMKSYRGHVQWIIGDESSEMDIWYRGPNIFLVTSKSGEIFRRDGTTMDFFEPKSRVHSSFKNLPLVTETDGQQLIKDLFDQSMGLFKFTLGPTGKVADLPVIELRATPKAESIVQASESQIYDEYSFPLKSRVKYKDGQLAQYEFSKISFNDDFTLPEPKIPAGAILIAWDFKSATSVNAARKIVPRNLVLEKSLKNNLGMTLNYYRNGAQFLSVVQYRNFGLAPKKGLPVKVGTQNGIFLPGPLSNILMVSVGELTSVYTSNLLLDDLLKAASFDK